MRVGLLARKVGMSRFFDSAGLNHPVTILEVDNCQVIGVNTLEKNGYISVKISSGSAKKTNKPFKGFLKKNNLGSFSESKEFVVSDLDQYKVGNKISVKNFIEGQFVDVSANSIGKGFAGGMKRHNFSGNRATHGVSISHRSHGSTGQCQDPGKVFKGKKMAGRLGNKKVTIQNLKVLKVDLDNNILLVKGAVPGHKGAMISVFDSVKKKQDIKTDLTENSTKIEEQKDIKETNSFENAENSPQSNGDNKNTTTNKPIETSSDNKDDIKSNNENGNKSFSDEKKNKDNV